jgi:hypothetical protein
LAAGFRVEKAEVEIFPGKKTSFFRVLEKNVVGCRVARWFVFKPKFPIWEGLRLENIYIFYCHLEYLMEIWGIL